MLVGDGSVDYKGRPANRLKTGGWRSSPFSFCKSLTSRTDVITFRTPFRFFLTCALVAGESSLDAIVLNFLCTPHIFILSQVFHHEFINESRAEEHPIARESCAECTQQANSSFVSQFPYLSIRTIIAVIPYFSLKCLLLESGNNSQSLLNPLCSFRPWNDKKDFHGPSFVKLYLLIFLCPRSGALTLASGASYFPS